MTVFKLILKRLFQEFRRTFLFLVIGPIVVISALFLGQLLAFYVECWAFGKATYFIRPIDLRTCVWRSDP